MTKPHVAVAFCSGDMVHADFAAHLAMLMLATDQAGIASDLINVKSSVIAQSRTQAVQQAQQAKATHILFLDSDMVFPSNSALLLLQAKKTVIGATYRKRSPPHAFTHHELGEVPGTCLVPSEHAPPIHGAENIREVSRLGTGCMLIDMHVFTKMTLPYFRFGVTEGEALLPGEDYLFCDAVRKLGFRVWLDCYLSKHVGHIGMQVHRP